ncbi:helix-turn-helix domain-containing protein [Bosea sp. NPDC055332]
MQKYVPKRIRRSTLTAMTPRQRTANASPAQGGTGSAELAGSIGREVRHLRRALDLTATQLASISGISNGMISKIESGTASASLETLAAIARALKVPVARLFSGHGQRSDLSIVYAGRGVMVQRQGRRRGHSYELLGHLLSGETFVEPYLVTIDQDAELDASFQHTGTEFLHVLNGKMEYRYGTKHIILAPGDSIMFEGTTIHGPIRVVESPIKFIIVIVNLRL